MRETTIREGGAFAAAPWRWSGLTLVVLGLWVAMVLVWLASFGMLRQRTEFDLAGYVPHLLLAGGLAAGAALVALWVRSRYAGPAAALMAAGGAGVLLMAGTLAVTDIVAGLAASGFGWAGQGLMDTADAARHAYLAALLLPLGAGVLAALPAVLPGRLRARLAPARGAAAWVVSGGMAWWGTWYLQGHVDFVPGLGVLAFSVACALGVSHLAGYGFGAKNATPTLSALCRWARESWYRMAGLGLTIGLYVAFVRPLIFHFTNYAIVVDWGFAGAVAVAIVAVTGGEIGRLRVTAERNEAWRLWRRHELKLEHNPHEKMTKLVRAQRAFVDHGFKEELVVYLVAFLTQGGTGLEDMVRTVEPLVSYEERRPPRFAFWGAHEKLREQEKARRLSLLDGTMLRVAARMSEMDKAHVVRQPLARFRRLRYTDDPMSDEGIIEPPPTALAE